MKSIFVILLLVTSFMTVRSQGGLKNAPNTKFISSEEVNPFLISTRPVTNREYLIYLVWLHNVYADYRDPFFNSFPGLDGNMKSQIMGEYGKLNIYPNMTPCLFELCIRYSDSYVKNYIFNPKYLDYPVIGITWLQASNYCKWLSDRFNEITLIKRRYYQWNPNQVNEDCFVTESHLVGQYEGMTTLRAFKSKKITTWKEHTLVPIFRLPTGNELKVCKTKGVLKDDFKSYSFDKNNILYQWGQLYLKVKDTALILNYAWDAEAIKVTPTNWEIDNTSATELLLNLNSFNLSNSLMEIFKELGQLPIEQMEDYKLIQKDTLGRMPFMIIDEDENGIPICVERYKTTANYSLDGSKTSIFRFACTMKPKQYMP